MQYISTRNIGTRLTASRAIIQGLAEDGGLLTPYYSPRIPHGALDDLRDMSYQHRAVYIMKQFLEEFSIKELTAFAAAAYGPEKFDTPAVAPVRSLDENTHCLELWHGPTCAFKDVALQMLPHLLSASLARAPWRASGTWTGPASWCSTPRTGCLRSRNSRWSPRRGRTWGSAPSTAISTTPRLA